MFEFCLEKQQQVKEFFSSCSSEEKKYEMIIALGKNLPPFPPEDKIPEYIVQGCQSVMYLKSTLTEGKVYFSIGSDALISAGLAAILLQVYDGESPEAILKCPPNYLEELGISASLTPSRANGLYQVHLRMKQDALKLYMQQRR